MIIALFLLILGTFLILTRSKLSYLGLASVIFSISIPDFYYVPTEADDLYRYYNEMTIIAPYKNVSSLLNAYKYNPILKHHSYNYVYDVFEWLISKTGYFPLLPVLVVFITYLCVSIPSIHLLVKDHISLKATVFGIITAVSLFPYWTTSSTVRWELASGVFFLITYLYCNVSHFTERLFVLLLYIIPCFIHEGLILPVILVALCTFIKRIKLHHFVFLIIVFCMIFFIILPSHTAQYSANIFDIASSYSYNSTYTSFSQSSLSSLLFYIFLPVISTASYYIGDMLLIKNNKLMHISIEKILFYVFNFSILFFMPKLMMFSRYLLGVEIIDIILFIKILKLHGYISKRVKILFIFSLVINLFIFVYLSLNSMQFNFSYIYNF